MNNLLKQQKIEFLNDVFITAIEGGINYWCNCKDYKNTDLGDSWSEAIVVDLLDGREYTINPNLILVAISKIINEKADVSSRIIHEIKVAYESLDAGEIDAELADAIAQIVCFGRVKYS